MDSKKIDNLMFHTPKDKSYQCADVGKISLSSSMDWNYTKFAPEHVDNTTIKVLHVRFDAFRNVVNGIKGEFRVIKSYLLDISLSSKYSVEFLILIILQRYFIVGFNRL
jgi:hypothetical protein